MINLVQHKKAVLIGVVFILAFLFFWTLINRYIYRSRAFGEPVTVFFEKDTITTSVDAQTSVPVNIFLQTFNKSKVSAAQIQVRYNTEILAYDETKENEFDPTCVANNNGLDTLINVTNDKATGTLTISRGHLNRDNTTLPPLTDSGIFCFGTLHFKPTPGLSIFPASGTVTLSGDSSAYEIVGPDKTYVADFLKSARSVTIIFDKSTITPTPTCKVGLRDYALEEQCATDSFHYISYTCQDGSTNREGSLSSCKTTAVWKQYAQTFCNDKSSCGPITTPGITAVPSLTVTTIPVPTEVSSQSAHLSFSPLVVTIPPSGTTFDVDVMIDAGGHEILSTDAHMTFDPSKLEVVSIKGGTYFTIVKKMFRNNDTDPEPLCPIILPASATDVNNDGVVNTLDYAKGAASGASTTIMADIAKGFDVFCKEHTAGTIYIAGIIDHFPPPGKTGRGVLATITFRVKAKGTSAVAYVCKPGETTDSNIANNDSNATDIIDCAANGTLTVDNILDVTGVPTQCAKFAKGDCNCDNVIDVNDFEPWRKGYIKESTALKCDYNGDGNVTLGDFNIWRVGYFGEKR